MSADIDAATLVRDCRRSEAWITSIRSFRLRGEGRWTEAAALYRELLRRDPHNDDAERWRRQLVAAEAAEVNERNAAVAAKRAAPRAEKAEAQAKPAAKAPAKASNAAAADSAQ